MSEKEVVIPTKPKKVRKPIPTWEEIIDQVYSQIEWYATRFIIISVLGVVVGFIGLLYGILNIYFSEGDVEDASVFLGIFIGVGALVASFVLLGWGRFWRKKVEDRTIF
ncbi:MAG: hypothetical protein Q6362_003250 [Candidatus Wukongarchaeota archaeon]|nr:hypothetical protein [Candidatus Wukongarchaeota archaeon]MDO8128449.1 hypothetical protein [Candidatus Wukongarchaeota archaeon]